MINNAILNTRREHHMVWSRTSSRTYSDSFVVFLLAQSQDPTPCWAKAWFPGLTPKINIFLWILLQNNILTIDNLRKRDFYLPNRCYLCLNNEESVNHMFIHCPFVLPIWGMFFQMWGLNWVFPQDIQDYFKSWNYPTNNPTIRNLWKFSFAHILWGIWKERNKKLFKNDINTSKVVWAKIKYNYVENVMARGEQCCNNKEDFEVLRC